MATNIPEPQPGECNLCGEPQRPGSANCASCADWTAQEAAQMQAQDERRQRLRQAREERSRRLAELAAEGCGCASEAECRLRTTCRICKKAHLARTRRACLDGKAWLGGRWKWPHPRL
jgi:hypothetical protein